MRRQKKQSIGIKWVRERELEGRSLESEYQIFEFVISEVAASDLPKRPALGSNHVANMEQK